jgi:2-polyprenyl-3-methyl-5-hydroxy-6-metoxy-1,4-benzoquinol methylase
VDAGDPDVAPDAQAPTPPTLTQEEKDDWNRAWLEYEDVNRKKMLSRWKMLDFESLPRDTSVLDIGAGCGEFLEMLRDAGFTRLKGVEPELDLIARGPEGLIEQGGCLDLSRVEGPFDVVTIFGVLHHLRNFEEMKQTAANIRNILAQEGRFYSVEPWKHLIRTLVTRVFLETPLRRVHPYFHLESRIWQVEKPLFEQWLDLESDFIRHMTEEAGFRIAFDRKDLRAHYLIYKKV